MEYEHGFTTENGRGDTLWFTGLSAKTTVSAVVSRNLQGRFGKIEILDGDTRAVSRRGQTALRKQYTQAVLGDPDHHHDP